MKARTITRRKRTPTREKELEDLKELIRKSRGSLKGSGALEYLLRERRNERQL